MIIKNSAFIEFSRTTDRLFSDTAQMVPSDDLPVGCSWLYNFTFLGAEAEPFTRCRTSGGFELELSIPNRDPATTSTWFVEAREIDDSRFMQAS